MIIKSIQLTNYRRYEDASIEFPNGLIGIVGNNGAGKSTLIEAIGWCLYGNVAARTKKEFIKRSGASSNEDCKAVLELSLGSDAIRVERELRGSNSTGNARLFLNGDSSPEVNGMHEVSEYVARRTGMDYVAFFTSIFAKQKELNALSDLNPSERRKTIMRLLRIDKIDKVITQIREDIRGSKEKIEFLNPTLRDLDVLLKEEKSLEERKETQTSKIQSANQELSMELKLLDEKKQEFTTHEKKYDEHNKFSSQLGKLESAYGARIEEKKNAESDLKTTKASEAELNALKTDILEFERIKVEKERLDDAYLNHKEKVTIECQIQEVNQQIKDKTANNLKIKQQLVFYKNLDSKLDENTKNISQLEKQRESLHGTVNQLEGKITNFVSEKQELETEFSKIKNLGRESKCPTCKRSLGDHFPELIKYLTDEIEGLEKTTSQHKKERDTLQDKVDFIKSTINSAKKEEGDLRSKISVKTKLETSLDEGEKTLQELQKQLLALEKKLEKYKEVKYNEQEHNRIKNEFKRLEAIYKKAISLEADVKRIPLLEKRCKDLFGMIGELEKKMAEKRTELLQIGFNKKAYELAKKALDNAKESYQKKREELIQLRAELLQISTSIKQNKESIKEEKDKRRIIELENKNIEARSKLEQIMAELRAELLGRISPMLSTRASELFRIMTRGKYSMINLDHDYNISIEDNGMEFGINRFSGGEEDLANLCLRLAISQEMSERAGGTMANFIALDEIFGSQDSERKNNILKALTELSSQFKQILLITHVEDVKESLPFVLNVKDDGHGSVKIEQEGDIPIMA